MSQEKCHCDNPHRIYGELTCLNCGGILDLESDRILVRTNSGFTPLIKSEEPDELEIYIGGVIDDVRETFWKEFDKQVDRDIRKRIKRDRRMRETMEAEIAIVVKHTMKYLLTNKDKFLEMASK